MTSKNLPTMDTESPTEDWTNVSSEKIVHKWESGTLDYSSLLGDPEHTKTLCLITAYAFLKPHTSPPAIHLIERVAEELIDPKKSYDKPEQVYEWWYNRGLPEPVSEPAHAPEKDATKPYTPRKLSGLSKETSVNRLKPETETTPAKTTLSPSPAAKATPTTASSRKSSTPATSSKGTPTPTSILGKHSWTQEADADLFSDEQPTPVKPRRTQGPSATGYVGNAMLAPPRRPSTSVPASRRMSLGSKGGITSSSAAAIFKGTGIFKPPRSFSMSLGSAPGRKARGTSGSSATGSAKEVVPRSASLSSVVSSSSSKNTTVGGDHDDVFGLSATGYKINNMTAPARSFPSSSVFSMSPERLSNNSSAGGKNGDDPSSSHNFSGSGDWRKRLTSESPIPMRKKGEMEKKKPVLGG